MTRLLEPGNRQPPLEGAHYFHSQLLLSDGRVLLAGGPLGATTQFSQTYSPSSDTWSAQAAFDGRKQFPLVLLANGQVLAVGGYSGGALATTGTYDPTNDTWTASAAGLGLSLATGRYSADAFLGDHGQVVAYGGINLKSIKTTEVLSAPGYDKTYLTYGGGPVDLAPKIYLIFYGNWTAAGVNNSSIIETFAQNFGGSLYESVVQQFHDGSGKFVQAPAYGGAFFDTSYSKGKFLQFLDPGLIVQNLISKGSLAADPNGIYLVVGGPDIGTAVFGAAGYHSPLSLVGGAETSWQAASFGFILSYTFQGWPAPNGSALADSMINTIAHEVDEAITDPQIYTDAGANICTGWDEYGCLRARSGGEVGDLCHNGVPSFDLGLKEACI